MTESDIFMLGALCGALFVLVMIMIVSHKEK